MVEGKGDRDEGLEAQLREVFAVLPDSGAAETAGRLARRYLTGEGLAPEVPWVDFARDGQVLLAGITALDDLSTRLYAHPGQQAQLAELVDIWSEGGVPVGAVQVMESARDWFAWFSPALSGFSRSPRNSALVRGLAIHLSVFARLVDEFADGAKVTAAEKRTLFQLVAGSGPREAAEADGVSFETKRAQIKSLCAKLACAGQTDLVRLAVSQLVHLLHLSTAGGVESRAAEAFARRHLPPEVRLTVHMLGDGRTLRTFECGPLDGRPLVLGHGMMFPLVLLNSDAECHRRGMRLIVPLRSGYLDDQSPFALTQPFDRSRDQDDIARFIAQLGQPVPLIGHSIGASWALDFARRHRHSVSRLVLLSPNFLEDRAPQTIFGSFLHGLQTMASRPGMLRYIAWQFRQQFLDRKIIGQVLRRACGENPDDLAVLDGGMGAGPIYDWFEDGYRSSIVGIADDTDAAASDWRRQVRDCPLPVTILVSAKDPVARIDEWRREVRNADLRIMPDGGHFAVASHPSETWKVLASLLT